MGGGTWWWTREIGPGKGLSPRGRGNRERILREQQKRRSIPAWAGEPSRCDTPRRSGRVYPRVGGGTWLLPRNGLLERGLSPRGRGNRRVCGVAVLGTRSIPAWAGEPTHAESRVCAARVYPRVGGGTRARDAGNVAFAGLSPRGRGNPRPHGSSKVLSRSIPAWAGEPTSTER